MVKSHVKGSLSLRI